MVIYISITHQNTNCSMSHTMYECVSQRRFISYDWKLSLNSMDANLIQNVIKANLFGRKWMVSIENVLCIYNNFHIFDGWPCTYRTDAKESIQCSLMNKFYSNRITTNRKHFNDEQPLYHAVSLNETIWSDNTILIK